jgi:hypothetical protein
MTCCVGYGCSRAWCSRLTRVPTPVSITSPPTSKMHVSIPSTSGNLLPVRCLFAADDPCSRSLQQAWDAGMRAASDALLRFALERAQAGVPVGGRHRSTKARICSSERTPRTSLST